jgi:two-component system, OmpR family, response regulator
MRILVIEDDTKIAAAIQRGLRQQSYAVDVAHNADDGLLAAESTDYDLLIVDIMLPGSIDGIGIVTELRQTGNKVAILLLTARTSVLDRAYGLNAGADDYLVKPFAFVELIARVRALLRRPQQNPDKGVAYDHLTLDPNRAGVICGDETIPLGRRDYALLEYLMLHPGRIISKSELLEHVWDEDADVLENTVEAHIASLRRKLEKPSGKHFISTKRGFGYVFGEAA